MKFPILRESVLDCTSLTVLLACMYDGASGIVLVLTGMMNDGEITRERAVQLARMVMRENAVKLYGLNRQEHPSKWLTDFLQREPFDELRRTAQLPGQQLYRRECDPLMLQTELLRAAFPFL